ncbi:MAG TPA: lamin tail domain-containing protein, partial [Polyangia bacterium]
MLTSAPRSRRVPHARCVSLVSLLCLAACGGGKGAGTTPGPNDATPGKETPRDGGAAMGMDTGPPPLVDAAGPSPADTNAPPPPDAGATTPPDTAAPLPDAAAPADMAMAADVPKPSAGVPPEVDGRLVINEFMASNGLTLKNEAGLAGDWIELFNPTAQDIPLAGYALTDNVAIPNKAVLAAGLVVKAGGHLLLWLDGATARGPQHVALTLESEGGTVALARPDGSFITRLAYGAQETDFSAARTP